MAGDIISQEPYKYSLDYHQFADFLGLDRETKEDFKTAKKVAFIYDWAKEIVGRDDRDTIMSAIRDYQKGLGVNFVGQKLVDYLYQQVRLDMSSGHPKIVEKLSQRQVGAPKEEKGPDLIEKKLEKMMKPIAKRIQQEVRGQIQKIIDESVQSALKEIIGST